jgi:hypothetical protein
MQQRPEGSSETRPASAWKRIQQGPENATELWFVRVCGGLVVVVLSTTEMVLTQPSIATFVRHLGVPVVVPHQPIGYVGDGDFNIGLLLTVFLGALLGYAAGHGIYRLVWPMLHRHG